MEDRRHILDRGRLAAELLEADSFVMEALKDLQDRYTNEWKTSKVEEVANREKAYQAILAIEDLKTQLQTYADRATFLQRQMQRE
jgi:hypothetical protein